MDAIFFPTCSRQYEFIHFSIFSWILVFIYSHLWRVEIITEYRHHLAFPASKIVSYLMMKILLISFKKSCKSSLKIKYGRKCSNFTSEMMLQIMLFLGSSPKLMIRLHFVKYIKGNTNDLHLQMHPLSQVFLHMLWQFRPEKSWHHLGRWPYLLLLGMSEYVIYCNSGRKGFYFFYLGFLLWKFYMHWLEEVPKRFLGSPYALVVKGGCNLQVSALRKA